MLAKCANPSCGTQFQRFNEGKLFRLATPHKREEYFWLCGPCSATHVLAADSGGKPQLKPKPKTGLRAEDKGSISTDWPAETKTGDVAQHVRRGGRHLARHGARGA